MDANGSPDDPTGLPGGARDGAGPRRSVTAITAHEGIGHDGISDDQVTDDGLPPAPGRHRRFRWLPRPVLQIGRLLLIALVIEYLVLPQIAGTRQALHTLSRVSPLLLFVGFVLEAASICAYAMTFRTILPEGSPPGFFRILRIQLTTLSVSHCVPGGSAAGSSLGYRLLTTSGASRTDTGFALATQSLGSAVVLNAIFWIAIVVSIPVWGFNPLYITAAAVGAVLVGGFVTLVLLFTRGEERAAGVIYRVAGRLPLVDPDAVRRLFVSLGQRMRTLGKQRAILGRAVLWAAANWLLDAGSLFVFVGAFGHWVNVDGLVVAYGLANVLAAIPLTPGGLGVVEATLTTALVGFDTTRSVAILGVVAYRLVNFWLPIPVGGVAYVSLQVDRARPTGPAQRQRAAVRQVLDRVRHRGRAGDGLDA